MSPAHLFVHAILLPGFALAPAGAPGGEVAPLAGPSPDTTVTVYRVASQGNEARYRVREQLANLSFPNDAVGATDRISGQLVLRGDGTVDPETSRFVIDMASLASDSDRRDNFLRRNTLETDTFPHVVLVPRSLRGLSSPLPTSGEANLVLLADLTVREVTRPTTWEVAVEFREGEVAGRATTLFSFEELGIEKPRVRSVLSVEDHIRLEYDFRLVAEGRP